MCMWPVIPPLCKSDKCELTPCNPNAERLAERFCCHWLDALLLLRGTCS